MPAAAASIALASRGSGAMNLAKPQACDFGSISLATHKDHWKQRPASAASAHLSGPPCFSAR